MKRNFTIIFLFLSIIINAQEKGQAINPLIGDSIGVKIKTNKFSEVYTYNSEIEIKLRDKRIIIGKVKKFEDGKILVITDKNEELNIDEKAILAIKKCYRTMTKKKILSNNCKYRKVSNVVFKLVKKKYDTKYKRWYWVLEN